MTITMIKQEEPVPSEEAGEEHATAECPYCLATARAITCWRRECPPGTVVVRALIYECLWCTRYFRREILRA